jgi:hypothetical protein
MYWIMTAIRQEVDPMDVTLLYERYTMEQLGILEYFLY